MSLAPPSAGASNPPQAAAQPQQSFRDRKAAQLQSERAAEPAEQPTIDQDPGSHPDDDDRTLRETAGSAQDLDQDGPIDQGDDGYEEQEDGQLSDDPEGTLDASPDDEPGGDHDWEKRYSDLRSEFDRVTGTRAEMEQEHAESMGENLRLKFDLEDRLTEAVGRAEYMANVMSGNANQFRNINWSQVPAEKLPQVQAQAQQALAQEQQAQAAWRQVKQQADETKSHLKQREAAIAKTRLKRTIGLNNEVYGQLREHAVTSGMSAQDFNEITNPVLIEALHAQMQMRSAGNTVQTKNKRRPNAPRNRNGARAPRDAQGKYAKSTVVPNQRGSFADKHKHRLAMERQGR